MADKFITLNDPADPTFNQLLAINDSGTIAGYFGSGATGHPNQGYTTSLVHPGSFTSENFPTAAQTQVTGINNSGVTVGFWVDGAGDNLGFVDNGGRFTTALDPLAPALGGGTPVTEQFLGVNDRGQAAGFYLDAQGQAHGFVYNTGSGSFAAVTIAGATSVTATDANDQGQISGFFQEGKEVEGFVDTNGHITELEGPEGASNVQALGLNDAGQVVGSYVGADGNTHGFVYNEATHSYTTIDDPNAAGSTVVNGINNQGELVGFYTDAAGNVDGMVVQPQTPPTVAYDFTRLDDHADKTFNQLLAINDSGTIAGYFGSGAAGHPNQGYTVSAPDHQGNFVSENVPTAVQTQVTGINNTGTTVGFWVDGAGDNLGFVDHGGQFTTVLDPAEPALGGGTPVTEQLLGVNDRNQAAGFYLDAQGAAHGFIYNTGSGSFSAVNISGATSVTATDINNQDQISGFFQKGGQTEGFIDRFGFITVLAGPAGASNVQALGLNDAGQTVGSYVGADGNTHGFVYNEATRTYTTINDPHAVGSTVVNGITNHGELVGFYTDKAGHVDGMLVRPETVGGGSAMNFLSASSGAPPSGMGQSGTGQSGTGPLPPMGPHDLLANLQDHATPQGGGTAGHGLNTPQDGFVPLDNTLDLSHHGSLLTSFHS